MWRKLNNYDIVDYMQKFITYSFNKNETDQSKIDTLFKNAQYKIGDKVQFQMEQDSAADFRWKFVNGIIIGYSFDLNKYVIMYSIKSDSDIVHNISAQSVVDQNVA
jgi:ribosomal protein S17